MQDEVRAKASSTAIRLAKRDSIGSLPNVVCGWTIIEKESATRRKGRTGELHVQGKVKWFSPDKGFGFIYGEDGVERHFAVRDIVGADLPSNGTPVKFEHEPAKKGPRATKVVLLAQTESTESRKNEERALCASCGKRMVPRIIVERSPMSSRPVPINSVCPYCGVTHQVFPASDSHDIFRWIVFAAIVVLMLIMAAKMSSEKKEFDSRFRKFPRPAGMLRVDRNGADQPANLLEAAFVVRESQLGTWTTI